MSELRTLRESRNMTQREVAQKIGISLRSYVTYENDPSKTGTPKYRFLLQEVGKLNQLDEDHGILSVEEIRRICADVFAGYAVDYCYLFGSYAKGKAGESSDVDLLISTQVSGLRFYELTEKLRTALHKKVDVLDKKQLLDNEVLIDEILREGIKIYG